MRAFMHGYFVDNRLYKKAASLAEPFAFEEYRKKKNQEKVKEERVNRVQLAVGFVHFVRVANFDLL
jgi:ribosome biogenesis protein ENP2